MKRVGVLYLAVTLLISLHVYAQPTQINRFSHHQCKPTLLSRSEIAPDPASIVRIAEMTKRKLKCSFLVLTNLAKAADNIEVFNCINSYLAKEESYLERVNIDEQDLAVISSDLRIRLTAQNDAHLPDIWK
jgi:hypothetical protein